MQARRGKSRHVTQDTIGVLFEKTCTLVSITLRKYTMDPEFTRYLKTNCPPSSNTTVPLEIQTPNRLDNKYYKDLKNHRGLLASDQTLFDSPSTEKMVKNNARYGANWGNKFAAAMIRMGAIDVLTGTQGEIRKNCRVVN